MRRFRLFSSAAILCAVLLGTAGIACAGYTFDVQIFDGTLTGTQIATQSMTSGSSFADGTTINTSGSDSNVDVTISTAVLNTDNFDAGLTLSSILVKNLTASDQTVTILMSAQGFSLPNGAFLGGGLSNLLTLNGTASATYTAYADMANGLNTTTGATASTSASIPTTSSSGGINATPVVFAPGASPFSLTGVLTLTISGSANHNSKVTSAGGDTQAMVPEPGTLAILASGLPLLGFYGLRRRRQAKANAA